MSALKDYVACLVNPKLVPIALRVAIVVGTLLFCINHGGALLRHEMTPERWLSVGITYLMPYLVNIHGQYARSRQC